MKILAFESSCDETAVAVVEDGRTILADAIASQADLHALQHLFHRISQQSVCSHDLGRNFTCQCQLFMGDKTAVADDNRSPQAMTLTLFNNARL